ncbi:MAG: lipid-A-disaccharide synthase-related protein [Pseudanabaenaceae cyanobacterium]
MLKTVLCISNGHGEDRVASYIARELVRDGAAVSGLPLVGAGHSYQQLGIPLLVTGDQTLPSGGFSRMSLRAWWQDVRRGLLAMTCRQVQLVKQWIKQYPSGLVLAVGDIVPLSMAWYSGGRYAFVATAKSEYYWRDRTSKLRSVGVPWGGSYFYPWERWLMAHPRCLGNLVRDQLTADYLRAKFNLPAHYLGNPMMDGLDPQGLNLGVGTDEWAIVILAGSRPPEAYHNLELLLICAQVLLRVLPSRVHFLTAVAPSLDMTKLRTILTQAGWSPLDEITFELGEGRLKLVSNGFADCLQQAHLGLAMAGTATEQLVGLGKPVITIAGAGPQFTKKFAIEQSRLLGCAVNLIDKPSQAAEVMQNILADGDYFQVLWRNAKERMGDSGASVRIAKMLHTLL